jgi:hypothetical protein
MHIDYHKQVTLCDFIIGRARSGTVWVKRYTQVDGYHSAYPLYEFPIETLGL